MNKKRTKHSGVASFPFDEFADMITINLSESQKMMRQMAKEFKEKQKNEQG